MDPWLLVRVPVFLAGLAVIRYTIGSAVRTFVVPRGVFDSLTSRVFSVSRKAFALRLRRSRTYEERDHIMAYYAPLTLLFLPLIWLSLIFCAYVAMFWAISTSDLHTAFVFSGSSLLTLGFATGATGPQEVLTFTEAAIGLLLLALLIAYLPTMYSAWAQRETGVSLLEVWAGSHASPIRLLLRYNAIGANGRYGDFWTLWITWFSQVAESHTSLAPLAFFRSPRGNRSWVLAAGAVLDMASLVASSLDLPRDPSAEVTIRSGYLALRQICDLFRIPYDPDPLPSDPISVTREQFDHGCRLLAGAGIPLKADLNQAWRDYAGWRVTYDQPLRGLAALTVSPEEDWFPEMPKRKDFFKSYRLDTDLSEEEMIAR